MVETAKTWTNPAAMRRSLDPLHVFKSPLANGRINRGYENLEVVCLKGPDERDLDIVATLAAAGHAGAFGDVVDYIRDGDLKSVQSLELADVGLQQVMEGEHVTFLIYGCTRAFTHEMVRTRKGAWYLQQTLRHTDMGDANLRMPVTIADAAGWQQETWINANRNAVAAYQQLVEGNVPYEDARTVLPLATETWIIAGMPLRTWLETFEYRACLAGDSIVHTLKGDRSIAQLSLGLNETFDVYSVNAEGRLAIGKAHRPRITGRKQTFRVKFDTGDEIKLTADHRVMMRDGSYKEVQQLSLGDSVMPFNREYLNGYPVVFRGIEEEPIAAHKFTVLEKRGIRTKPYRYGDARQQVIHHIDFDKNNASDENLLVLSAEEHIKLHASLGRPLSEDEKTAISERMRANNPMKNPATAELVAAGKRGVPNPAAAERMRGNSYARGKGTSQGGNIGGTPGHKVSEASLRALHNHKVVAIEPLGIEDVYDMSVDEHHNFAVQGIFVHNCYMFYPEMRWVFARMKEELAKRAPKIAAQARITCERKGVCTYRGAEDTECCPIYPGAREWRSKLYDDKMLLSLYNNNKGAAQ